MPDAFGVCGTCFAGILLGLYVYKERLTGAPDMQGNRMMCLSPHWSALPLDLLLAIFTRLDFKGKLAASQTCQAWNEVLKHSQVDPADILFHEVVDSVVGRLTG